MEPIVINLKKPIDHGQGSVTQLVFSREPILDDFFELPPSGWSNGEFAHVISRLTDQPLPVIKRLSVPDYQEAFKVVQSFLAAGQGTGSES